MIVEHLSKNLEKLENKMENKQELILNRIILFNNIYSEYECHLDSIPSRLLNGIIREIENNDAILFTLNCLKETSFCNHTKSLLDNPFYLNNLIDTFNSLSYQNLLYKQSSDENVIRKILDTLLFLQSYEFKLNINFVNKGSLYDYYIQLLCGEHFYGYFKCEEDYMRRYIRQFDMGTFFAPPLSQPSYLDIDTRDYPPELFPTKYVFRTR